MDTKNTSRQLRYLEEVRTPLHRAGFGTLPVEGEQLPVLWNGTPLCRITGKGSVFYRRQDVDTPQAEDALYRVEDIAAKTLEYMTAMKTAPQLKASGLDGDYRILADFGGTVLAGTPSKYGVQFVTWDWDYDRTGVVHGHYFMENYDIDVFADALLCDIRFKVPYIGELICDTDCPAVEDYNDFAEALEGIWQKDGMLLTYAAVLEAERPDTLRGACELLRNLDNYQRITEGAYGYGQQRLQETLGLDDEAIYELEGYMDFEKYGQDCMENDCVTKTEFGLLRRLDPPFQEQTQGQQMFQ